MIVLRFGSGQPAPRNARAISSAFGPCNASARVGSLESWNSTPCGTILGQVRAVLVDLRRVDDEKKFLLARAVKDQVVDHAALIVQHQRVLALAHAELRHVIGQHAVEEAARARTAHEEFAHVRDVEEAGGLAHRAVFVDDAAVLHGHGPAAEFGQARAEALVGREERRLFCESS